MTFQAKVDSPEYYWLEFVSELQSLLDPEDPRYVEVWKALFYEDLELLDVAAFCLTQPGNPAPLTVADFTSGAWKEKFRQAAYQAAFYRLCEEV